MEKSKGKIPSSELIVLESSKEQWEIFAKGLVKKFETTGLIQVNDKKLRISIRILSVTNPFEVNMRTRVQLNSYKFDEQSSEGIRRASEFFSNLLDKHTWIILGYVKGDNKIPIVITYYENIKMSVYSIQLTDQNLDEFFRNFPKLNLN